jgi:hypothetical protein
MHGRGKPGNHTGKNAARHIASSIRSHTNQMNLPLRTEHTQELCHLELQLQNLDVRIWAKLRLRLGTQAKTAYFWRRVRVRVKNLGT